MELLYPITAWHWLAIGLVLIGIEAALGTFDLLWVAVAAGATALVTAAMPGIAEDWRIQFAFFFATSVVLIILGRTLFAGLRRITDEHPTLNKRMTSLIGRRGMAASDFQAGIGRVKIGDTEWSAESVDGGNYVEGSPVMVEETAGNVVKVRLV